MSAEITWKINLGPKLLMEVYIIQTYVITELKFLQDIILYAAFTPFSTFVVLNIKALVNQERNVLKQQIKQLCI